MSTQKTPKVDEFSIRKTQPQMFTRCNLTTTHYVVSDVVNLILVLELFQKTST